MADVIKGTMKLSANEKNALMPEHLSRGEMVQLCVKPGEYKWRMLFRLSNKSRCSLQFSHLSIWRLFAPFYRPDKLVNL